MEEGGNELMTGMELMNEVINSKAEIWTELMPNKNKTMSNKNIAL